MLHSLGVEIPSVQLPNIVFFDPKEDFLSWVKKQGLRVVDAGAGVGRLCKRLNEVGVPVIGIDANERDNPEFTVHPMDAVTFPYNKGQLVILARPNGGDWIEYTMSVALRKGARVVYVGLEKNYDRDLTIPGLKFTKVVVDAGEDGEEAWEVTHD